MSTFSFRGKSGLIHVYDYLPTAKISICYTVDDSGNTVDQIPAHCDTLDSHVRRVMYDFNTNNQIISDDQFDAHDDTKPSPLAAKKLDGVDGERLFGSVFHFKIPPHMIPSRPANEESPTAWDRLKACYGVMYDLWKESAMAFVVLVSLIVLATVIAIPVLIVSSPLLLVAFMIDYMEDRF